MKKKLLIALLVYTKGFGGLPPKDQTQVIIQGYIFKPYTLLQEALDYKIEVQRDIIEAEAELRKVDNTSYLTEEQKTHRKNAIHNLIKELKEDVLMIPDSKEEKIVISTLEHSFGENLSLGVQALFKENKLLNNKRQRPIEGKIFGQFQFLKWHKKRTTQVFIISPHVILTNDPKPQLGAKLISERYVQHKKHTNISQMEAGITQGPWGVKYSLGISNGIKTKRGFLLLAQNFTDIDSKNPIKVYKLNSKQIISIAKDNYDQGLSWQIGIFNYTSPKLKFSLYKGVFFSLWRYF